MNYKQQIWSQIQTKHQKLDAVSNSNRSWPEEHKKRERKQERKQLKVKQRSQIKFWNMNRTEKERNGMFYSRDTCSSSDKDSNWFLSHEWGRSRERWRIGREKTKENQWKSGEKIEEDEAIFNSVKKQRTHWNLRGRIFLVTNQTTPSLRRRWASRTLINGFRENGLLETLG